MQPQKPQTKPQTAQHRPDPAPQSLRPWQSRYRTVLDAARAAAPARSGPRTVLDYLKTAPGARHE